VGITAGSREVPGRKKACDKRHPYTTTTTTTTAANNNNNNNNNNATPVAFIKVEQATV